MVRIKKKKKKSLDSKITRHANAKVEKKKKKENRGARRGKGVEEITRRGWQGRGKRHRPGVELKVNVGGVPMYV